MFRTIAIIAFLILLGSAPSEFSRLSASIEQSGRAATITPALRAELVSDLRRWNAAILVLRRDHRRADAIRRTVEGLAGPSTEQYLPFT